MDAGDLLTHWTVYPSFLIGWAIFAAAYLIGVGTLRRRHGSAARVEARRVASFFGGLVLLFLALQGPLHDLSDTYLFSAHMLQHLVLTLLVPPLLLAGTPPWLLSPLLRPRGVLRAARFATRPVAAFALYNALFAVWHVPALYDLMMREHDVHVLMHLSILAAAVILWWPVLGPARELGRLPYAGQILYLFLLGIPMMGLAAIITLSDRVLYPWYTSAPRLWGLTPAMDQQIGGLIMWVPGSMVLWAGMTIAFFRWAGEREAEERPPLAGAGPAGVSRAPGGDLPSRR